MSSVEFAHYAASYQLHPPVGNLIDVLIAVLCAVNSEGKTVKDFLPDRHQAELTEEERVQTAFAGLAALAHRGKGE